MTKKELSVGLLQQHNTADITDNMHRLEVGVRTLAAQGAELIVLQELHNSLYFCQTEDVNNFDLAEPIPGPSTAFFGQLARECNAVIVKSSISRPEISGSILLRHLSVDLVCSFVGTNGTPRLPD